MVFQLKILLNKFFFFKFLSIKFKKYFPLLIVESWLKSMFKPDHLSLSVPKLFIYIIIIIITIIIIIIVVFIVSPFIETISNAIYSFNSDVPFSYINSP